MLFPSVSVPGELTRIALSDVHAGDDLPNVNALLQNNAEFVNSYFQVFILLLFMARLSSPHPFAHVIPRTFTASLAQLLLLVN